MTAPFNIPFGCQGFLDHAYAKTVSETFAAYIREFSRYVDVERLDGVTLAYDFDHALSTLDRGVPGLMTLTRSTTHALGVAMAPAVIRDGVVKGHIVFHASLAERLLNFDFEDENFRIAYYSLAHEMAHIHDLKMQDIAFPDTILRKPISTGANKMLFNTAHKCWDEYVACRISARFSPKHIELFEQTFLSLLAKAKVETDAAKIMWKSDRDMDVLMAIAIDRYGELLKYASYVIGHLHGLNSTIGDASSPFLSALKGSYFQNSCEELANTLNSMWQSYGNWKDSSIYDDLESVVYQCFQQAGFVFLPQDDGTFYVVVRHESL